MSDEKCYVVKCTAFTAYRGQSETGWVSRRNEATRMPKKEAATFVKNPSFGCRWCRVVRLKPTTKRRAIEALRAAYKNREQYPEPMDLDREILAVLAAFPERV